MRIKLESFWHTEFTEHEDVAALTRHALYGAFDELVKACTACIEQGGKIFFFGNGGSAADAQHLATELTARYKKDRQAIAAIALTTDTSALTAIGNDYGFERLFSRQIEALGRKGDIAIGISTSGNSPNVMKAFEECRARGKMLPLCDIALRVPSSTTARIQEMHITLGQMLCGALEINLGYIPQEDDAQSQHKMVKSA
jgi:D-sedoheptulose 7-phosphate isomerase